MRTGSKAIVLGSISNLGGQYVIGLDAVGCSSGDTLAKEQEEAASKQDVLKALGKAAASLRAKLGESLASVQKFDVPVEATTPSLEALKAYSMGITTGRTKGDAEAIPFMKRAIELDPNFAMAYVGIAVDYSNLGRANLAADNAKKAYDLRDRVSERERYRISAFYFQYVTGEVEKATEAYELWAKSYPRDLVPHGNLGVIYSALGQYDKAIAETEVQQRLEPTIVGYGNQAGDLHQRQSAPGRPANDPGSAAEKLRWLGHSGRSVCLGIPVWGYGGNGAPGRDGRRAVPAKKTRCSTLHADTQAYYGRLEKARDLARRATDSAVRADAKETGAQWLAYQALREAEIGNVTAARQSVTRALALAPGRDVNSRRFGAGAHRRNLSIQNHHRISAKVRPHQHLSQGVLVPGDRGIDCDGATSTRPGDRRARTRPSLRTRRSSSRNLNVSRRTFAAWLISPRRTAPRQPPNSRSSSIIPELCRTSCLALSPISNSAAPTPSSGDTAKAKAAYQDFLVLWKDADPDIPILKEAKAEYAKLQ